MALYVFDKSGKLVSATIDDLGSRDPANPLPPGNAQGVNANEARRDQLLATLGDFKFQRINIEPFRLEMFGVVFGFIPQPPEDEDEEWSIIVEPGNVMWFYPPWTSGDYDT